MCVSPIYVGYRARSTGTCKFPNFNRNFWSERQFVTESSIANVLWALDYIEYTPVCLRWAITLRHYNCVVCALPQTIGVERRGYRKELENIASVQVQMFIFRGRFVVNIVDFIFRSSIHNLGINAKKNNFFFIVHHLCARSLARLRSADVGGSPRYLRCPLPNYKH